MLDGPVRSRLKLCCEWCGSEITSSAEPCGNCGDEPFFLKPRRETPAMPMFRSCRTAEAAPPA